MADEQLRRDAHEYVERVWEAAGMALSKGDFAAMRIGWDPKPENLAECAAELGIGIDSFVFVDDNPGERAEMAARLPSVAVADFPISFNFESINS